MADEASVARVTDGGDKAGGASYRRRYGRDRDLTARNAGVDVSDVDAGGFGQTWDDVTSDGAVSDTPVSLSGVTSITSRVSRVASALVALVTRHKARSAGIALGVALAGAALLSASSQTNDGAIFWVDDDDPCVNYVSEAKAELGVGENQIDATWNGHAIGTYATREFDLCSPWTGYHGLTSPYCFPRGTAQQQVQQAWIDAGAAHDAQGFCRLGDCYLIACTSVYGEVGDHITFYFDDGSSIECIKVDAKHEGAAVWFDSNPATKWGHDDGRCVLEFCGRNSIGDEPYGALGKRGRRTVAWTNHGKAVGMGGVLGSAQSNIVTASQSTASGAMEECKANTRYDNSTLVAALVSYSYSQRREQSDSEPSTALYQQVCEATLGVDDYCYSYHYHSCDRGVAAAVRWTGADVNFPAGACDAQYDYCYQSPLWEVVVEGVSIDGGDDWALSHGIQPGDVGISRGEHTLAYVGHDNIVEGYAKFIRGNDGTTPGTGGDIGEPTQDSAYVMASSHSRGAGIQSTVDGRTYTFFRYVGDYPDRDRFADVGSSVTLAGANVHGTPCDCEDVENETCGEQLAIRALQLAHSAVDDGVDYNVLIAEAGLSGSYVYSGGNIYNIYPPTSDVAGAWGSGEPMDERLRAVGISLAFEDWQRDVVIPRGYPNANWYACCSPWVSGVLAEAGIDTSLTVVAADQREMALSRPDVYRVIPLDPSRSWEEQCEPGDILNSELHTAMWVGNELAQRYWPGTSGNVVEAGQVSRRNLGVTRYVGNPGGMFSEEHLGVIIRVRCPDDSATLDALSGDGVSGLLFDGPVSATQLGVIAAARQVASPGGGLCAMWVSQVFNRAGMPYYGGNACDMYHDWCRYSDRGQLKPGMIVAVPSHPHTTAGSVYGHVGIYIGNGQVMDNIGSIRTIDLDSWISYYGATRTVKWGWIGGRDLRAKGLT